VVDLNGRFEDGVDIARFVDAGTDVVHAERFSGAIVVVADDDGNKVTAGAEEDEVVGGMLLLTAGA
jgi:hypothetical protein